MVATINAILGHPEANSYLTLTQADALAAERGEAGDWDALSDANKNTLLIQASSLIDTLPLIGRRVFNSDVWHQRRRFPVIETGVDYWLKVQGTADSGSTTTLVSSLLESATLYRDDIFNDGSIAIISGTGQWQHATVTDFVLTTGTVTFAAQSTAIDSTSVYTLLAPLPDNFIRAVLEQAVFLAKGGALNRAQMIQDGIVAANTGRSGVTFGSPFQGESAPNIISAVAAGLINPYLAGLAERT